MSERGEREGERERRKEREGERGCNRGYVIYIDFYEDISTHGTLAKTDLELRLV